MKADIHPKWYADATVNCACGNSFTVGSIKQTIRLEICNKCHPFFTGEMKFVDTLGRVEKFQKKQQFAQGQQQVLADKKKKKKEREDASRSQKSLKDMLMGLK